MNTSLQQYNDYVDDCQKKDVAAATFEAWKVGKADGTKLGLSPEADTVTPDDDAEECDLCNFFFVEKCGKGCPASSNPLESARAAAISLRDECWHPGRPEFRSVGTRHADKLKATLLIKHALRAELGAWRINTNSGRLAPDRASYRIPPLHPMECGMRSFEEGCHVCPTVPRDSKNKQSKREETKGNQSLLLREPCREFDSPPSHLCKKGVCAHECAQGDVDGGGASEPGASGLQDAAMPQFRASRRR